MEQAKEAEVSNDNAPHVREFSSVGPCLTLGKFVRETARFFVYAEWLGDDRYGAEKRVAKPTPAKYSRAHVAPCRSCRDHGQTQYPNGYMD